MPNKSPAVILITPPGSHGHLWTSDHNQWKGCADQLKVARTCPWDSEWNQLPSWWWASWEGLKPKTRGSPQKEEGRRGKWLLRRYWHTGSFVRVSGSQSVFWGPLGVPEILSGSLLGSNCFHSNAKILFAFFGQLFYWGLITYHKIHPFMIYNFIVFTELCNHHYHQFWIFSSSP